MGGDSLEKQESNMSYDPAHREMFGGYKNRQRLFTWWVSAKRPYDLYIEFDILSGCTIYAVLPQVQAILRNNWEVYYLSKTFPPLQGGQPVSAPAELVYIKLSRPPVPLSTCCMWLL